MAQIISLATLDPQFLILADSEAKTFRRVPTNDNADGIIFLCPKCYLEEGSPVGVHSVICWIPSIKKEIFPGPGRWVMSGQKENLTLTGAKGKSSSVKLTGKGGCKAHFFVTDGTVKMC